MELLTKYGFMILGSGIGLALIAYIVNLDKRYPETPTNPIAYWIVGGYITFVCAGPDNVGKALQKIADKVSNFTISFKRMSNKKASKMGHCIYWFVVVLGALLIPIFLLNQINEIGHFEVVKKIKALPHTARFNYESIKPTKTEFEKDEKIFFLTTRTVVDNPPYIKLDDMQFKFEEFLFCDYGFGYGYQRVDPFSKTEGGKTKAGLLKSAPRRWLGGVPDFLPAECKLRSKVCIEVEDIEKCQYITSDKFTVNK